MSKQFKWTEAESGYPIGKRVAPFVEFTPEILAVIRTGRKMSQREVAEAIGTHRDYISKIEQGARRPSYEMMGKIGEALGVIFFK